MPPNFGKRFDIDKGEITEQVKMHRSALLKLNHADVGKAGELPVLIA